MGFSRALLPSIVVILKYERLFVPIPHPPCYSSSPLYEDPKNEPIITSKLKSMKIPRPTLSEVH
jgi:hypothetical protein